MKKSFSIFSNTSNKPAAAEEHSVAITFHNQNNILSFDSESVLGGIIGYMTNEFSYSSTGNYKNVWGITWQGDSMPAKLLSDETQRNFFNYGYATKKMYANGEAPSINISFTCYAGDDENNMRGMDFATGTYNSNNPIYIANMLIAATLPQVSTSNAFLATNIKEEAKGMAGAVVDVVKTVPTAATNFVTGLVTENPLTNSIKGLEPLAKTMHDAITSHKPPVCNLKIGNIFEKDMMVVRKVDAVMSKEYLRPGVPLYGKFDVTFESLFNSANLYGPEDKKKDKIFGTGLKFSDGKGRVSFSSGYGAPKA